VVNLHAPQLDAALIATIARLHKKPVILTYHCDLHLPKGFIHRLANLASNLANHLTARLAHRIIHNTRDYAEQSSFLRKYLHKIQTVFTPVQVADISLADRQAFREKFKIIEGQPLIGMAARLATEKGVEFLAQALPSVLERFPHARVLFVGPYQDVVGELAYAQKLRPLLEPILDHWSFLGILSPVEMASFFTECDVTVLPSINSTESFGIVQVESMTCGTPVVASDLPGVRVPIHSTGMGLIVPVMNSPAISQALIEILENPSNYRAQNRELIQLSTPEAVADVYEKIFNQVIVEISGITHPVPEHDLNQRV
jgi:glycosyltransferase involved in cell wall biosynthesis